MLENIYQIGVTRYLEKTGASAQQAKKFIKMLTQASKDLEPTGKRVPSMLDEVALSAAIQKKYEEAAELAKKYDEKSKSLLTWMIPGMGHGDLLSQRKALLTDATIPYIDSKGKKALISVQDAIEKLKQKRAVRDFTTEAHDNLQRAIADFSSRKGMAKLRKIPASGTGDRVPKSMLDAAAAAMSSKGWLTAPGDALVNYEEFRKRLPKGLQALYPENIGKAIDASDSEARRALYKIQRHPDAKKPGTLSINSRSRFDSKDPFPELVGAHIPSNLDVEGGMRPLVEIEGHSLVGTATKDLDHTLAQIDRKIASKERSRDRVAKAHAAALKEYRNLIKYKGTNEGTLMTDAISDPEDFGKFIVGRGIMLDKPFDLRRVRAEGRKLEKIFAGKKPGLGGTDHVVSDLDPVTKSIGWAMANPSTALHNLIGDIRFRTASKNVQEKATQLLNVGADSHLEKQIGEHRLGRIAGVGGLAVGTAGLVGAPVAYYTNKEDRENPNKKLVGNRGNTPLIGRS